MAFLEEAKEKVSELAEDAKKVFDEAKDKVDASDLIDKVKDGAGDLAGKVKSGTTGLVDKVKDLADGDKPQQTPPAADAQAGGCQA